MTDARPSVEEAGWTSNVRTNDVFSWEGGSLPKMMAFIIWSLLAPVLQTLDSAIHRINHYPADKYLKNQLRYPLDRDLSGG